MGISKTTITNIKLAKIFITLCWYLQWLPLSSIPFHATWLLQMMTQASPHSHQLCSKQSINLVNIKTNLGIQVLSVTDCLILSLVAKSTFKIPHNIKNQAVRPFCAGYFAHQKFCNRFCLVIILLLLLMLWKTKKTQNLYRKYRAKAISGVNS